MTVVVSGATGHVGRFIAETLLSSDHQVRVMSRSAPPDAFFSRPVEWVAGDLDPDRDHSNAFQGAECFIHSAFQHEPGRYRGGEGDDPDAFVRANVDGTMNLMRAAKDAGVARVIFLSSRAVYGSHSAGTVLTEATACMPDTLYGLIKLEVEQALAEMASPTFLPIIVRATGIYGPAAPGRIHKWAELFADFAAGVPVAPRVGTEVHGDDLAAAVDLLLKQRRDDLTGFGAAPVFNVSDILLDRQHLLAAYADAMGIEPLLPPQADTAKFNVMDCSRIRSLGWAPRGHLDLAGIV